MLRIHEFTLATKVRYGFGSSATLAALMKELHCKNALVVTDPVNGHLKMNIFGHEK